MLRVCPSRRGRGLPGSKSLSFASPKESNQRKGDPVRRPLRGTLRCSVQPGSETTHLRLKQVSALIRLALRFSAPLQGFGEEEKYQVRRLASSASRLRLPESIPHPVEAGPSSADGGGRSGQTCLSAASCLDCRRSRAAQVARSDSEGTQTAGRLSFGYFSLAKQRKVTCRRATPGLYVKGEASTHGINKC